MATSLPASEIGASIVGGTGSPTGTGGTTAQQANASANQAAPGGATSNGAFSGTENDIAQTAAVTPLANVNGTLPASPGVGPAGGVAVASASSSVASGPGVAAGTLARSATTSGAPASAQVAQVAPIGGSRGPGVVAGAPTSTNAAPSLAASAAAPGVAAGAPR